VVESGVISEGLCITYEYIFVYGFPFIKPLSVLVSKVSEGEDFLGYYGLDRDWETIYENVLISNT